MRRGFFHILAGYRIVIIERRFLRDAITLEVNPMEGYLDGFLAYLREQADNDSIYVWGAQGQGAPIINEVWIRARETSDRNAQRAIDFWKKQVALGYGNILRAFDCSGLIMYYFMSIKPVFTYDMSANGLSRKCAPLQRASLLPGDFVFREDKSGRVYHVGVVLDLNGNVIEARSRDTGVVIRPLDEPGKGYWNRYGRLPLLKDEIEAR